MNRIVSEEKYDDGMIRRNVVFECQGESMTEQSHKDSCDIKSILKKFAKSGVWPASQDLMSGNFTSVPDFTQAQEIFLKATSQFNSLPSAIRERFNNKPENFLSFMESDDQNNVDESYRLGLRVKPEPVKEVIQKVVIVPSEGDKK